MSSVLLHELGASLIVEEIVQLFGTVSCQFINSTLVLVNFLLLPPLASLPICEHCKLINLLLRPLHHVVRNLVFFERLLQQAQLALVLHAEADAIGKHDEHHDGRRQHHVSEHYARALVKAISEDFLGDDGRQQAQHQLLDYELFL